MIKKHFKLNPLLQNHAIRLVSPNEWQLKQKNGPDMFTHSYIEHCVAKDEILPNLVDYKANRNSKYKDYDPLDILLGIKKWSDLEEVGERVTGDEFDFDMAEIAKENDHKYKSFKTHRKPYSAREGKEIYLHLKKYKFFHLTNGNTVWKSMETNGLCNGNR